MSDFEELDIDDDDTVRLPVLPLMAPWSRAVTSRSFESLRASGRVRRIGPAAEGAVATNPPEWGGGPVGSIPDEYVVFENVFVTRHGAVVEGDDLFLEDLLFHRKDFQGCDPDWLRRNFHDYDALPSPRGTVISTRQPPVRKAGTFFLLTHFNPDNFGHFVHDVLSRFYIFDHLPEELRRGATLLCSPHPHPMQRFLLDAFRGEHPTATIRSGAVWHAERVIMPRNPMSSRAASAPALRHTRRRMQRIAGADSPPAERRPLYIARPNLPAPDARRLDNLAEFEALLEEFGFRKARCELLPVRAQLELFRSTSVLIGMHGAGMLNQLFLPDGATVIEVTGRPREPKRRRPVGAPMSPSWIVTLSHLLGLGGYYSVPQWRDGQAHADIATLRDFLEYLRGEGKLA